MGSEDGRDDERPVHRVELSAFELGECQVTNTEYLRFLDATAAVAPPFWEDPVFSDRAQPVVGVSWLDAVAYCEWLSGVEGRRFRLPTEGEWECAARGGMAGARYPWGNDPPQSRKDYAKRWSSAPEPVAQQPPNAYGLYDLCENVHEWCSDWYGAQFYAASPEHNPWGPASGSRRVSRGGSWRHQIKISRCAARSSIAPHLQYADYGFRIACDPKA